MQKKKISSLVFLLVVSSLVFIQIPTISAAPPETLKVKVTLSHVWIKTDFCHWGSSQMEIWCGVAEQKIDGDQVNHSRYSGDKKTVSSGNTYNIGKVIFDKEVSRTSKIVIFLNTEFSYKFLYIFPMFGNDIEIVFPKVENIIKATEIPIPLISVFSGLFTPYGLFYPLFCESGNIYWFYLEPYSL